MPFWGAARREAQGRRLPHPRGRARLRDSGGYIPPPGKTLVCPSTRLFAPAPPPPPLWLAQW
eukprot:scaffold6383_cov175-Prasinococcus_capsulatus_cf.AAC.1